MSDTGLVCTVTVAVAIGLFHRLGRSWHGHIRDALVGGVAAASAYTGIVKFAMWVWRATEAHPTLFGMIVLFLFSVGLAMFTMQGYMAIEECLSHGSRKP